MVLGILQARVSSTRLPGKVIKDIMGLPMIIRQVERVRRAKVIDQLLIATSLDSSDDAIEHLCEEYKIAYFRGSLNDVLDRFYRAAESVLPDHIVRLTGDCPLADPELIDKVISYHLEGGFDYTSNTVEPTYPDGLDIEVFRFHCLKKAWEEARLPSQREHVTLFMYTQPNLFRVGSFKGDVDYSKLRLTVDEPVDFELVTRIYQALYPSNPEFTTEDVLTFLKENKTLVSLNDMHIRNEGLQRSLSKDFL